MIRTHGKSRGVYSDASVRPFLDDSRVLQYISYPVIDNDICYSQKIDGKTGLFIVSRPSKNINYEWWAMRVRDAGFSVYRNNDRFHPDTRMVIIIAEKSVDMVDAAAFVEKTW